MQIFKITTEDSKPVLEKISGGTLLLLPTENDNLNNFNLPEVKNDSIYIIEAAPDNSNPLNYDGVGIALKIYFHTISNTINKIRIILFGFEDKQSFFQFCTYSNILKCPGIEYIEIGKDNIEMVLQKPIKELDYENIKKSILNIGIKPPTSYKSHHYIANEWSILRWAKALQIKSDSLKKIQEEVDSSLYYKYLKSIYPIKKGENIKKGKLKNSGKILFIDDEVEKGWGIIFKEICGVELTVYGSEFKDWNTEKIISESSNKAKEFDVVILDLRLHDDDFDENDPKDLTGYKTLKKIKEHNKGIQVIIFSATNKIWNLQALQEAGADGFIIKESPEISIDSDFTSKSITSIYEIINKCLSMSFLKEVQKKINKIQKNIENRPDKNEDLFKRMSNGIEIAFSLLSQSRIHDKFFNFSYLAFFQLIEDFGNFYFDEGDMCYVKSKDNNHILVMELKTQDGSNVRSKEFNASATYVNEQGKNYYEIKEGIYNGRIDTNCKISNILIYLFGHENSNFMNWNNLNYIRNNKAAHFNENDFISKDDLFKLINFIEHIFNHRNIKTTNNDKGLKYNLDIDSLKNKFNNK